MLSKYCWKNIGLCDSCSKSCNALPFTTQSLTVTYKASTPPCWIDISELIYLLLIHSTPVTLASLLFLTHTKQSPASGPLHLLCLPLESSPPCIIPFSLQVFAQLLLSEGGLPLSIYLKCAQAHTQAHTHTHSLFPVPALFIVCLLPARV